MHKMRKFVCVILIVLVTTGCSIKLDTDKVVTIINKALIGPHIPVIIEESIYKLVAEYMEDTHPDIEIDIEQTHVNTMQGGWYAYIYDKYDKGLGFEIYGNGEEITDNIDNVIRLKRKELIYYMNEIMPENKQYNEYVNFNTYENKYESSFGSRKNLTGVLLGRDIKENVYSLKYTVVSKNIDKELQKQKDNLIINKYLEIMNSLEIQRDNDHEIEVRYIEVENTDLEYYKEKYKPNYEFSKRKLDRYTNLSSLYSGKQDCSSLEGLIGLEIINYEVKGGKLR